MTRPSVPVLEIAVEPQSPQDEARLGPALGALAANDVRLGYFADPDSGLTILRGDSEPHLDRVLDALIVGAGVGMHIGRPQVGYREALREAVAIDQAIEGGSRLTLLFEPAEDGAEFSFADDTPILSLPMGLVAGLGAAFEAAAREGALAGFPFDGLKVTLTGGYWREPETDSVRLLSVAREVLHRLAHDGKLKVVEPIMRMSAEVPLEFAQAVAADLDHRGEEVETGAAAGGRLRVTAEVPLASLFGYAAVLRSLSEGTGDWSMVFERYAEAPLRRSPKLDLAALRG